MSNEEHANKQEARIRLGVSPLSWVNEVLEEYGHGTSADTCLVQAAAGYAGVEMSRLFPREAGP